MRVKKPTSKRVTTRMREGIKKKAAAHVRKQRKLAKKDPTWKSRKPKDPGIPASFPFKDKILQEIEQGRQAEAERKERNRLLRAQAQAGAGGDADMMEVSDEEDDGAGGLAALLESAQQAAKEYDGASDDDDDAAMDVEVVEQEVELPDESPASDKSRKAYDKIFKAVVEAADVVVYVLDARDPESTRSRKVEQAVLSSANKALLLVLNKADLVPENNLNQWLNVLRSQYPTIAIKASGSGPVAKEYQPSRLLEALKKYGANRKRSLVVGVIGYPNVGKSSVINALTGAHGSKGRAACPTGNLAGVTTSLREVKVDQTLKVVDSPGIVFPDKSSESMTNQLAVLSAIPPKLITDPQGAVKLLVKKFSKDDDMARGMREYYGIPPLASATIDDFVKVFLIQVARSRGRLNKFGVPNMDSAALQVLHDWRDGRIRGWTPAPAMESVPAKAKEGPKTVEEKQIVTEWAAAFDLDGLLA
ncbi:hypothetical protein DIURU_003734 [Diutina rugosa]|uniref:CP-type G domain-containing protein n=1 Tax=Diutina rugosa TaxID=5481 RepID=A0A642UKD8_DIURU|nr:uncharacterized protein DIURU_003734 [Diutina rugosa]KAA8900622.1 hypothetical protein DIURU_003734 [Diutina rugosa]